MMHSTCLYGKLNKQTKKKIKPKNPKYHSPNESPMKHFTVYAVHVYIDLLHHLINYP